MKTLIALAMLGASAFAYSAAADPTFKPPKAKDGHSYPECYCTNRGVKVAVGKMSCLRVGGREFTARCGMSLNNPAWREVKDGCEPGQMSRAAPNSEFLEPS